MRTRDKLFIRMRAIRAEQHELSSEFDKLAKRVFSPGVVVRYSHGNHVIEARAIELLGDHNKGSCVAGGGLNSRVRVRSSAGSEYYVHALRVLELR